MKVVSHRRPATRVWFAATLLALCFGTPSQVLTQTPPAGVLVGATLSASLRNAGAATKSQAIAVQNTAQEWARRASSANYSGENFQADLYTLQLQFLGLRERFTWMGNLVLQSNRPSALNSLVELEAGLNIIEELVVFLNQQFNAGNLDPATLVRTCRTLREVTAEWEHELKRSSSRLGVF